MLDRLLRAFLVIGGVSAACAWTWHRAFPEADPLAVLVRYHTPNVYTAVVAWYYVAPGAAALLSGQLLLGASLIWFARMGITVGLRTRLPTLPLSPTADGPAIVIGEVHHPVKVIERPAPEWLTIPERGLYTGVAIFGAVGSGKTSAYAPVRVPTLELARPQSQATVFVERGVSRRGPNRWPACWAMGNQARRRPRLHFLAKGEHRKVRTVQPGAILSPTTWCRGGRNLL